MPHEQQIRASGYAFPEIAEVLEQVILQLDLYDTVISTGDAMIPRFKYKDHNLWDMIRGCEDEYLAEIVEVPVKDDEDDYGDEKATPRVTRVYYDKLRDIRCGFMDVRYPNGWPIGLRELHCDMCDAWHTDFQFQGLHPLLQFLGDMTMCFRGNGARLKIGLARISTNMAPNSCFEYSCEEAVTFAKHLKKLCVAVAAGGEGVATNSMAQPWVTKFVFSAVNMIQNEASLTITEVAPLLQQHGGAMFEGSEGLSRGISNDGGLG
ncbi:hypothetical protein CC86DRAFT_405963 [Ophiobolus disseminans]|uniref:Uncharacterized protein n=1 Tax=Ophiobolus disseminans TaxID=1469910 RepID=A0A6A7A0R5_9PLEO|nr:hypothetical protein CC86DRAFT_405963 [Ophiobolus disseminans]